MDKDKLKLIVRNLELLVDSLKAEVYSDTQSYLNYEKVKEGVLHDYDEIFEDDNDDGTNGVNNRYRLYNDDDGDGL
jgi:uncharacterized protein VirK/YbjX